MNSFTVNLNAQICVTIMSTPDHMREADLTATNERSIRAILEEVFLSASTLCTVLLFIAFSLFLLSICFIKCFGNPTVQTVFISTPDDRRDAELSDTNQWNMRSICEQVFLQACTSLLDHIIQMLF